MNDVCVNGPQFKRVANGDICLVQMPEDFANHVPSSLIQHIALCEDRTLLVSHRKAKTLDFHSLKERLIKFGMIKAVEAVEDNDLSKLIAEQSVGSKIQGSDGKADSTMQKSVLAIIDHAIQEHASDIHIEVKNAQAMVYFRVNGDIDSYDKPRYRESKEWGMELMRCIYQSMTDMSGGQFSEENEQSASFRRDILPDSLFGVRIEHTPIFSGHYMVGRLLYRGTGSTTLESLGYEKSQIKAFNYMMRIPHGIILLAGVTGSGKTTTIACALDQVIAMHEGKINVLTVEDPVEFIIRGARQKAVTAEGKEKRAEAYNDSLKSMMRLDPDVGMISELRDETTVLQAIQMALTGHQVWSTVHAIDIVSILPRLAMMGVPSEILADNKLITGLVAQSLVKKLCPCCRISAKDFVANDPENTAYILHISHCDIEAENVYFRGEGCRECGQTGYIGRTVLAEVVIPDATFMDYYRKGDRVGMRRHAFSNQRWMSRHAHARIKINRGEVDPRDVESVIGPISQDIIEADSIIATDEINLPGMKGVR